MIDFGIDRAAGLTLGVVEDLLAVTRLLCSELQRFEKRQRVQQVETEVCWLHGQFDAALREHRYYRDA